MQVSDDNIRLNLTRRWRPALRHRHLLHQCGPLLFAEDRSRSGRSAPAAAPPLPRSRRNRRRDDALQGRAAGDLHLQLRRCGPVRPTTITGTKGSVTLDPAYEYADGLAYTAEDRRAQRTKKFPKSDQFAPELLDFSDCILNSREPEPSGEEGLADVRIIEGMLQSISNGAGVRWRCAQRKRRPTCDRKSGARRPARTEDGGREAGEPIAVGIDDSRAATHESEGRLEVGQVESLSGAQAFAIAILNGRRWRRTGVLGASPMSTIARSSL